MFLRFHPKLFFILIRASVFLYETQNTDDLSFEMIF